MRYPWIFFDADNTLFDFSKAETESLAATLEHVGLTVDEETVGLYKTINRACWDAVERGEMKKSELRTTRFERFLDAAENPADAAETAEFYAGLLRQSDFMIDGALELLEELRAQHGLVLITNGLKDIQRPRLAKSGLNDYFRSIVISEEIGVAKPHEAFFTYAFNSVEQPDKKDVLVVGDNIVADIGGALSFGCDACWFQPETEMDTKEVEPTYTIQKLEQLLDIVR